MGKLFLVLVLSLLFTGCSRMSTPYGIPNVTVQGTHQFVDGKVVNKQQKVYELAYEQALKKDGVDITAGKTIEDSNLTNKVKGDQAPHGAYKLLFFSGMSYSKAICTDYFKRVSFSKAHRENSRKQTNIIGGLTSAVLGLAGVPAATIGGVGAAFSAVDSGFDAYDSSFLVTPNLGLLSEAVYSRMREIQKNYEKEEFSSSAHVLLALSEYTEPCTHTGMQSLMDKSLKDAINLAQPDP